MSRILTRLFALSLMVFAVFASLPGCSGIGTKAAVEDKAADEDAVRAANAEFYAALNSLFTGDAAPTMALWSHAHDITYMGPMGGLEVGWEAIEKVWKAQAALKLGGRVEPKDIQINVGRDLAVVSDVEVGENTNARGVVAKVSIRATNVYRKEGGKWKMIGHHTDLLPYLVK